MSSASAACSAPRPRVSPPRFSFKKLAKKAAREIEAETYVINGVDTAPALYTILVSSEDDLAMRPLYAQITKETAQFIEGQAQGKGYALRGQTRRSIHGRPVAQERQVLRLCRER